MERHEDERRREYERSKWEMSWHGAGSVEGNLSHEHGERLILYAARETSQNFGASWRGVLTLFAACFPVPKSEAYCRSLFQNAGTRDHRQSKPHRPLATP